MNFFKRAFLALMITLLVLGSAALAASEQPSPYAVDLIIVMDNSKSLNQGNGETDPNGFRFDAAAAAISMLDSQSSKANYLYFDSQVKLYSDGKLDPVTEKNMPDPIDISLPYGRANRSQFLTGLTAPKKSARTKYTADGSDIGEALTIAVDILSHDDSGNQKIIILLIDGGVEIPNQKNQKKKENDSKDKIPLAREKAEENGIAIHTVLLNNTSVRDFAEKNLCTKDGSFTFVRDAQQLPGAFMEILSDSIHAEMKIKNIRSQDSMVVDIPVLNGSAAELNVLVPLDQIDPNSLQLVSPAGKVITGEEGDDDRFISPNAAIFKVYAPQKGDWKLQMTGNGSNSDIMVRYVLDYRLLPQLELSSSSIGKTESVTVTACFTKDGKPVDDEALYDIPATVSLMKDGETVATETATKNGSQYTHTFSMKPYGEGNYTVSMHFEGNGLKLDSSDKTFSVINNPPELREGKPAANSHEFVINTPGEITSFDVQSYSWILSDFVADPDGDQLYYTISSKHTNIDTFINEGQLKVFTKGTSANETVIVSVSDSKNVKGELELSFPIKVTVSEDDLGIHLLFSKNTVYKNEDSTTVTVQYTKGGFLNVPSEYDNIKPYLTLKKDDKVLTDYQNVEMQKGSVDNCYTFELKGLKAYGVGSYTVEIQLQGGGVKKSFANGYQFTLENRIPELIDDISEKDCSIEINDPEKLDTYQEQSIEFRVTDYARDPDDDPLKWKLESNTANFGVHFSESNSILKISAKDGAPTEGDVVVSICDSDSNSEDCPRITFHVKVTKVEDEYSVQVTAPGKASGKKEPVTIEAHLLKNGNPIEQNEQIQAKLSLFKGKSSIEQDLIMNYHDGVYSCTFDDLSAHGEGTYKAEVTFTNGSFNKKGHDSFILSNGAPVLITKKTDVSLEINVPGDSSSYRSKEESVELNQYAKDPEGDMLTWEIDQAASGISADSGFSAEIDKNGILIVTIDPTNKTLPKSKDIIISVKDSEGKPCSEKLTVRVNVVSVEDDYQLKLNGYTIGSGQSEQLIYKPISKTEPIKMTARFTKRGIKVDKDDKVINVPVSFSLYKEDGTKLLEGQKMSSQDDGSFTFTLDNLRQYGEGKYRIVAMASDGFFTKKSDEVSFELTNQPPVLTNADVRSAELKITINTPGDDASYHDREWTKELSGFATDPEGDAMEWFIRDNAGFDAKIDEKDHSTLIVTVHPERTDQPLKGDIIVSVQDSDGKEGPEFTVQVDVVSGVADIGLNLTGYHKGILFDTDESETDESGVQFPKHEPISITAQFTHIDDGEPVKEDDQLNSGTITFCLYIGNKTKGTPLLEETIESKDGLFTFTFNEGKVKLADDKYTVVAKPDGTGLEKLNPSLGFELTNQEPVLKKNTGILPEQQISINIPGEGKEYSYDPKDDRNWISLDMTEYVSDPNGDELYCSIIDKAENVSAYIMEDKHTLIIQPKKNTSADETITVFVADSEDKAYNQKDGEGVTVKVPVKVVSVEEVYGQYMASFLSITADNKNADISLILEVLDENGQQVRNDSFLPEEIKATVTVNHKNETVCLFPNEEGYYEGTYHTGNLSASYKVNATVLVGEKKIRANEASFSTINRAPKVLGSLAESIPQTLWLGFGSNRDIDLANYFYDPDGDELRYEVINNNFGEHADVTIDGGTLRLRPKSGSFIMPFTGNFQIKAKDNEDRDVNSVKVSVKIMPVWVWIGLAAAVVAVIILLLRFFAWKNAHFGKVAFDVSYGYQGLELPDGLSEPLPEGGHNPVTLDSYYTEQARLVCEKDIPFEQLQKISLKPLSKDRIQVTAADDFRIPMSEERPEYQKDNRSYTAKKMTYKSFVLEPGESFSLYANEYSLSFRLVHIAKVGKE